MGRIRRLACKALVLLFASTLTCAQSTDEQAVVAFDLGPPIITAILTRSPTRSPTMTRDYAVTNLGAPLLNATHAAMPSSSNSPGPTPSRSPHGTLSPNSRASNVEGNVYIEPSKTSGAFIAPSLSSSGYAQFTIEMTGVAVPPGCRGVEWLLGSGAAVALRSTLSKLSGVPMARIQIAWVDDGYTAIVDGYPALGWANAATGPPPRIDTSFCSGGVAAAAPSAPPGASPSQYSFTSQSDVLTVGLRFMGNGTLTSVNAMAAAVTSLDPDQVLSRFTGECA